MRRYVVACIVAVAMAATQASAQSAPNAGDNAAAPGWGARLDVRIPQLIAYQGKLTDSTGRPVDDGSYVMVFSLSADSTGSSFWHETQAVETRGGLFNILLGSKVPISADSISRGGCYLGIRVLPSTEEFHRQRIVSVPFAFQADNSDRLQGRDSAALDSVYISHTDTNAVTSVLIVDGTITRADVSPGFTAPYADTADYAKATPAVDSARVAGNSHLLQGKDTTALWNAKSLQGKDTAALWNAKTLQGKDTTALWNAKALQGKDTTGFVRTGQADAVTSAMMVNGTIVRADVAGNFKAPYADTADYAIAAPASDSARVAGNSHLLQGKDTTALWDAKALQGKDTTGFVRTGQTDAVTSAMIVPNTIVRADVASNFKAPYSDTADYAISAPASDSARVAGNSHLLQTKDTTALWNAKTLQGKDTTGFVRTGQVDAVTNAMIVNGTIVRNDVAANFKAPYSDTADYAVSAPASDSARVAGNSHLLQTKDTTTLWNAKTLQGKDTAALWNAKTLQGKDTTGFVRTGQPDAVISAMIVPNTIVRADVATNFKAPYTDTADYAKAAPASDSARVAGNSHLLQTKDTTALWNAKTLQGKDTTSLSNAKTLQGRDTTGFVRTNQANAVTSAMVVDGTVVRADVASNFKAPYSDTADYASSAPASDSARVAGNSHLLQGKDTTALWNAKTLQGKDTTGFVRTGQPDAVTSAMIVPSTIVRADVATNFKAPYTDTADYARAAPASDSARVAGNSHLLQTKDTTALWNAKTLQGKDTTALDARYVNEAQVAGGDLTGNYPNPTIAGDKVTSAKILDGTIASADLGQMGATSDQVMKWNGSAWTPRNDSGTVTGVSQSTGIICSPNPITSTGTVALDQSYGDGRYVNEAQANSISSAMVVDGTIVRADVATNFKAPYSDTADYAISAPASDSARVAGNSHLLQTKDTTALWNAKTLQGKDTTALSNAKTLQGKDTTGFVRTGQVDAVTSAMIVPNTIVRSDVAAGFKAPYSDTADYAIAAPASDSARVSGNSHLLQTKDTTALWNAKTLQGKDTTALSNAKTLQGKDTTGFVRTNQANSISSAMVVDGTIVRADVATNFKAPYSDTADYAIAAPASDSARVAGNSHQLQGKDTTALWNAKLLQGKDTAALWNAKTLQGKDTTGFVRTGQTDAVTSAMIVPNTIARADVATNFKAPYSDTADYAIAAPASDSARVAGNSHLLQTKDTTALWNAKTLQGKDTTALWNAKTLQGKDTVALWNAKTLQGKDTTGFVRTGQTDAVTSAMIVPNTIGRADVASNFKAPYSDTADYAIAAPASDSARVAGSSHLLQTKDTTALWNAKTLQGKDTTALGNAKTLQGKDTTGFVRTGQADAVTSAMIVPNTIVRSDVASTFKAPYSDTADYAIAAPASDSARVAGNSHLLQTKDTTALWNAKTLQGKDTTGFVRTGQADAVTSAMIVNGTVVRADVAPNFKAPYSDTADYAIAAPASDSARVAGNSHLLQGKDTTGFVRTGQADAVTSAMIVNGTVVRADVAATFKAPYSDTADYAISAPVSDSARVAGNSHLLQTKDTTALWNAKLLQGKDTAALWSAKTLQGKDTTGFVRTGQVDAVTSAMIVPNTIVRADVASNFKAPYSDTADYAIAAPASDSARVAGNSHLLQTKDTTALWNAKTLQGEDTTALWNAKTLQGKDTTGFVRTGQADAVTSAMIVPNTIVRADVATSFKAPYSDTADYAIAAPASDSARVAGNSHLLQTKDTTALWNAKTLQGEDTTALWNAKTLQGKDTTGFVRTGQADAVTSAMIVNGTIVRNDVATNFKAPYSDTADYAIAAPVSDSSRVAGNSHLLQTKDTTALWNAKTLQGKDTTGFVRTGQADAVTSAMIVNGTIARNDVATNFKAPYSDTADYAVSAPTSDSARVAGNSHLLQGKDTTALWNAKTLQGTDTTALWNAKTLQGKDTTGFVRTGQVDAVTSAMIVPNTIVRADVAAGFKAPYADTADYAYAAPASDSAAVAANSHLLQGKDTTALWNAKTLQGKDTTALWNAKTLQGKDTAALWNAKTLQGKDTTGFVRTGQADAVTSAMIVPNTIVRADVASNFKAPYSDTADYAISAPASDSARVAGNSHLLQGKDTTALSNAKTLQGKDTTGFVRTGQVDAVTSAMIVPNTIARADVAAGFKAPYADTADYAYAAPASDSAAVAANSHLLQGKDTTALWNAKTLQGKDTAALWNAKTLQGKDTTGFVRTGQTGSVTSDMIVNGTIAAVDLGQMGAASGQVMKWIGSVWAPGNDSTGVSDNTWVRRTSPNDSVLWTVRNLGIARGGAGDTLIGTMRYTHVNLGTASATGATGQNKSYCTVGGGHNNTASGDSSVVAGGSSNSAIGLNSTVAGGYGNPAEGDYSTVGGGYNNQAADEGATVAGGESNGASGFGATVGGGEENAATGYDATVPGGYGNSANGDYSFAAGNGSEVPVDYYNSAAFNGQVSDEDSEVRCDVLHSNGMAYALDDPLDPVGTIMSQFAVGSPEIVVTFRGSVVIGTDGRVVAELPRYFDALCRNPMVQLTGVGTFEVYVADKVAGNRFVIGGKPGTEVYWTVSGERKDQVAEITRIRMPVQKRRTGALVGRSISDANLGGALPELQRLGLDGRFSFRTAEGRQRYEDRLKRAGEARQRKSARPVHPSSERLQPTPQPQPQKLQQ